MHSTQTTPTLQCKQLSRVHHTKQEIDLSIIEGFTFSEKPKHTHMKRFQNKSTLPLPWKKVIKLTAMKRCSISCLTCPLMIWMMGQRRPSASFLTTPNWEEWLIMPQGMLPPRRISAGQRNGLTTASKFSKDKCKVLHPICCPRHRHILGATQLESSYQKKSQVSQQTQS